ncbi:LuxR C-terminal-related transcriptional regulator [Streptomyces sp. NPDC002516]
MHFTHSAVRNRWPFIGRESEIASFLESLENPRYRCNLFAGPFGVGKSRLAEECWEHAVRTGYEGARATATEAARATPLGAVAHLLAPHGARTRESAGPGPTARGPAPRGRGHRIILVDDVQWLDPASVTLLRKLVDTGAARLVATLRSDVRADAHLEVLLGAPGVARAEIAQFDEPRVHHILEGVLGGPVNRRSAHVLHTASAGNAFYLGELVRANLLAGALHQEGEVWRLRGETLHLTPLLTDLVSARVRAAGPEAGTVLRLMAVCGPLSLQDVQDVAPACALATIERSGLAKKVRQGKRTVMVLAHPLFGEVLRSTTAPLKRRALLLDQIERTWAWGAKRAEDTVSIASWKLAATGTVEPKLAQDSAVLAGKSQDHRRVLSLLEAIPPTERTTESHLLYGHALYALGRCTEAEAAYAEAQAAEPDRARQIPFLVARIRNMVWGLGRPEEALEAVTAALPEQHGTGTEVLEELRGHVLVAAGATARGTALLEDLPDDATTAPDVNVRLASAMTRTIGLATLGRAEEAELRGKSAYAAHCEAADRTAVDVPASLQLVAVVFALSEVGRLDEARSLGRQIVSNAEAGEKLAVGVWGTFFLGRVEWLAGRPRTARRWFAESVTLARGTQFVSATALALAGLGAAAAVLGDVPAAQAALEESRKFPVLGALRGEERLGEAWLLASRGHLTQARDVLVEGALAAREAGHVTSESILLTDVARLGAARQVTERLSELARQADGCFVSIRARFAAALANGGPSRLLTVAEELQNVGASLLEAEAAAAAAAAWTRTGQTRRAALAAGVATSAGRRSEGGYSLRMAATPALAHLTAREQEIALQAAAGCSSKEIAATLDLSVRTVDNTLQRVYNKFGVNDRRKMSAVLRLEPDGS